MMIETRIEQLVNRVLADTGVDITRLYCLTSGRHIGFLAKSELELAVDMMPEGMDDDDIASELFVRYCAYSRPSPAWNMMRLNTLDKLRESYPREALFYLMARYCVGFNTAIHKLSLDDKVAVTGARIKTAAKLDWLFTHHVGEDSETAFFAEVARLTSLLIEIDAIYGLTRVRHPERAPDFMTVESADSFKAFVDAISDWLASIREVRATFKPREVERFIREKVMREQDLDTFKPNPNRLSSHAYVQEFFKRTGLAHTRQNIVRAAVAKPLTEKQKAKAERESKMSSILNQLMANMADESGKRAPTAPTVPVADVTPKAIPMTGKQLVLKLK